METIIVRSVEEARSVCPQVAELFTTVFNRPFPDCLWEQYYFDNPYGPPSATLLYRDGMLIGHHALVPQRLSDDRHGDKSYHLSVSLMLHPNWRGMQAFHRLVSDTMQAARELGTPFVLGFPNANSFVPLQRFFGWNLIQETPLYNWILPAGPHKAVQISEDVHFTTGERLSPPYQDAIYWDWRTKCGDYGRCHINDDLSIVYSLQGDGVLTLLDVGVRSAYRTLVSAELACFASSTGATVLRLSGYHADQLMLDPSWLTPHESYKLRLCIAPLSDASTEVQFSLMLSDVF